MNSLGYSGIHAFYPNLPKFFQQRFNFTNTEAGSIASLPYVIASLSVPVFGSVVMKIGEKHYESLLMFSLTLLALTHIAYILLPDWSQCQMSIWPLVPFGLGHALFTIMLSPTVPKIVPNKDLLPNCFSLMKIIEGFNIMTFTYLAGYLRQRTGDYSSVTLLLLTCNLGAMAACFHLLSENCWYDLKALIKEKKGIIF